MSGDRQLQVHQRLDVSAVEMKYALAEIKQAKRGHDADDAQHRGDPQHQAHVPGLGCVLVMNIVVGDGQYGAIVEQRQHHDHYRGQRIKVEDQDRQSHEQQHAERLGDTVDRVAVHALEDTAALLDRVDDYRQAGRNQHDGSRRARRVRRARNGDTAVRLLQRRGIIHPVASHANDVTALLQVSDDMELVFGEHLGKTVGLLDCLSHRRRCLLLFVAKASGIKDICAHPQCLGGFPGDGQRIAGHHLDLHAHMLRGRDGRLGIVPGRVEQGQHAKKLPFAISLGPRHAQ